MLDLNRFADQVTRDIFFGDDTKAARKALPHELHRAAGRKLNLVALAETFEDLCCPPGNRPKRLQGPLVGFWSVRINDQWRIVFRFENGMTAQIRICDYH